MANIDIIENKNSSTKIARDFYIPFSILYGPSRQKTTKELEINNTQNIEQLTNMWKLNTIFFTKKLKI